MDWLGSRAPTLATGVSWGVPWARGAVRREQTFTLQSGGGPIPLQTWPLAYWPDGSVKWTGHSAVVDANTAGPFRLAPGAAAPPANAALKIAQSPQAVEIDTGKLQCRIPRQGPVLLDSLSVEGRVVARGGHLIATLEDRSLLETARTIRYRDFTSQVKSVTVEQSGPVRAVVRIDGVHKEDNGNREWLPFTVRLYFYAGDTPIRMLHSFVFDGDQEQDFLKGLGVAFTVPMREQMHNRHVRFSGEGSGLWAEPLQPLTGRQSLSAPGAPNPYVDQLAGKRVPNKETFNEHGQFLIDNWAVWDAFKLTQSNADGFTIHKRTNPQSCWLFAGAGKRANGLVFVGDVSGGLAAGVRNFWQSHPASLEVLHATQEAAELRAWFWSPDAPAMDLRHYDIKAHNLDASYEDVQPGFSIANGIGRTSELTLFPSAAVPTRDGTVRQAQALLDPPLLVAAPEYLHSVSAFGIWSLPDRSTPFRREVEDGLSAALDRYRKDVDQRQWYGFWDFGDVMHAYDAQRHTWRYDIGGFAWDNTELGTDMWLWYSFLRTGRADIFRMAEAMTRHTSEVDTYHSGRFAMLGSRHNVRHWGCGAKEARISQAAFRRYYYYLTTDERTGDIMREVLDVDAKMAEIDPMRLASPQQGAKAYPARVRGGPDWLAFVGNWMTEWERTGNLRYRDKILAGMDSIAQMPYGFMTGPNTLYGYDPQTGRLYPLVEDGFGTYNLQVIQGGAELVFELNQIVEHAGWQKAWLQYCRITNAPKAVVAKDMASGSEGSDGGYAGPGRMAAYAYWKTKNPAFVARAVSQIAASVRGPGGAPGGPFMTRHVEGPDALNAIEEAPYMSTNSTAQNSLQAIQILELCKDRLPETMPPAPPRAPAR